MFDIILHFPFRFDRKTKAVYLENCYIIIYREFFFYQAAMSSSFEAEVWNEVVPVRRNENKMI